MLPNCAENCISYTVTTLETLKPKEVKNQLPVATSVSVKESQQRQIPVSTVEDTGAEPGLKSLLQHSRNLPLQLDSKGNYAHQKFSGYLQTLPIKHDWYQTDSAVVITVLVKNIKDDQLKVSFADAEVNLQINVPEYEECNLIFKLAHKIVPDQCSYKLSSTKIEVKLKKTEGIRWIKLEGEGTEEKMKLIPQTVNMQLDRPPSYPTSKKGKDWNQVEKEIKKQEKEEKLKGEEALNKLFQDIYGRGSDDVKKAMNKSYFESGGTVLSTSWSEVANQKVDVKPTDGMEFKKWNS